MFTMKRAVKFAVFLYFFLDISSGEYILGDVKMDNKILKIYYTTNATTGKTDWVSVCYNLKITKSVAHVVCHQRGYVGAMKISSGSWKDRYTYSFTQIECPTVSDYNKYGESHILRCSLEGPILSPYGCDPVTVECNSEHLTQNPYKGQVTIQYAETGSLSDGIIKVFFGGKWAGICYDDNFPSNVADSVCRQRGYTGHSSIEEKGDSDGKALVFSSYSCTQSSFACFSHCIVESSHHFEACQYQIYIRCKFNSSVMLLQSSGSSSQCALTSENKYKIATVVLGSVLGVTLILVFLIIILSVVYCCYKCFKRNIKDNLLKLLNLYNATDNDQDAFNDQQT